MPTPAPKLPRWAWLGPGLIACLCYLHALALGFPYDDVLIVRDNWFLRDPGNVVHLVTPGYFRSAENSWRPAATATHLIEMQLVGAPPVPAANLDQVRATHPVAWDDLGGDPPAWFFHGVNVLLHAVACVLLALCTAWWAPTAARAPAAFAAGLALAVHPAASEAVCVISFREDLLAGAGMLGALWWLHPWQPRTRGRLVAGWACAATAIFAKETAILLPLLLWVSDRCAPAAGEADAPAPRASTVYGPVWALAAVYLLGRFVLLRGPMEPLYASLAPALGYRLLLLPAVWLAHLQQLLFPVWLNADHFITPVTGLGDGRFWLGGAALLGAGYAWWRAWRARWMAGVFGGLLIAVTWAPVSNLLPLPNPFAERYLYVEIAGLAWLCGGALGAWWPAPGTRRNAVIGVCAALACAAAIRTAVRVPQWKDSDTIWAATRASGAVTMRGFANRTSVAEAARDWDGWAAAAREWKAWAEQWPEGAGAWRFSATLSLGQAYRRKAYDQQQAGDDATAALAEAERWLTAAHRAQPGHPLTNEELGVLAQLRKQPAEAERWFRAAVHAARPNNARHRNALAEVLMEQGRDDAAIAEWRRALETAPGTHHILTRLADALIQRADRVSGGKEGAARSSDGAEAAALWRRALAVNPWDAGARFNLGLYHLTRSEPQEAAEPLLQAWRLHPGEPVYRDHAREALQRWSNLRPGDPALQGLVARYGRP
ncbi:MAG: tetratricopeptide repeat protein [Planctomycetota bacterium]